MRGTINDVAVFLDDDQYPSVRSSVNDILDPSKAKGATVSTVTVINTPEAARVLGTEFMAQVADSRRPRLRLGDGSIDLFSADIIPQRKTRSKIECFGLSGNAIWFEAVRKMKIRSMDLGQSQNVDASYQRDTWTDEDDILVFPLIDYGSFEARSNTFNVTPSKLRPAMRIHRLLEEAFASFGYMIRARGGLADVWKKFITVQSDGARSVSHSTDSANSQVGSPTVPCTTTEIGMVPGWFYRDTGGLGTPWDPGVDANAQVYNTPYNATIRVTVTSFTISSVPMALDGTRLRFVLYDKGSGYVIQEIAGDVLTGGASYSIPSPSSPIVFADVEVDGGTQLDVGIWNETGASVAITVSAPAVVQFKPLTKPYGVGVFPTPIAIATAGPDMTVADVISGLNKINCLAFSTDVSTKVVDVWFDREYFRKPTKSITTRDWTKRMDHSNEPAKLTELFAERIEFRYKQDKNDRALLSSDRRLKPIGYGSNDTVIGGPEKATRIEAPFSATGMVKTFNGLLIPGIRSTNSWFQEDDYDHTPRIMVMDGVQDGEWTHNTDTLTELPKCYFVHPDSDSIPLHFDNGSVYFEAPSGTVATRWDRRINEYLGSKTLEAYLFIRDHEVQDFDHGMPTLVDDGSGPRWYYVQEIMGHRFGSGEPTKCRLVEIPGAAIETAELVNPVTQYPAANNPVHFRFTSDLNASIVMGVYTNTGFFTVREPSGFMATYPSGSISDGHNPAGVATVYEVWASDDAGNSTGAVTSIAINAQQVTAFNPVNLPLCTSLALTDNTLTTLSTYTMASLTSIDCSTCYNLDTIDLSGSPLLDAVQFQSCPITSVDISSNPALTFVGFLGCALSDVDGIINALDPDLTGSAQLSGGSNAAPTGASSVALAALTTVSDLTVSGAGSSAANGSDYVLTTQLNGRDRYTHTGAFIFWNGTNWRIQTGGGDIYQGTEDVMQPWLVTTWTAIGGTPTPVPTLTAPSLGLWSVTTN